MMLNQPMFETEIEVTGMGRKKLLRKLAEFFDMDARVAEQKKDEIKKLLKKLKAKEKELKKKLKKEMDNDKKDKLLRKIDVVHSQRKKGIKMHKALITDGNLDQKIFASQLA